jgi:hypothetical protein
MATIVKHKDQIQERYFVNGIWQAEYDSRATLMLLSKIIYSYQTHNQKE